MEYIDGILCDISEGDELLLIATARIAEKLGVPMWYKRIPKKHGLKREIEGDLDLLNKCKHVWVISKYKPHQLEVREREVDQNGY